ncbi:cysteine/serine-rich nuclear protein 1 [Phascolarctos cinereus]|uniref:Cysteine/serine-rich nuclear protein 1 n=1 Tax=Phascolarctos cinereus TaxID=38626 RepID=A0A6P5IVV0_PHACI|nr:cysteine/serine-rich nuclear protein 1 [Phascolarctos cinereus]XP_020826266.1 cysteine/serine-rich nuclear protein 1 [Phascolarctos cinereus]XP_020826267.1 cysteine/serine-rich nuclear protein 1 [Phascolarctos cinereus]XP_020826268.1 cysteine/serine-rich nuclear protein 1 [Phascolarctos cinereus]
MSGLLKRKFDQLDDDTSASSASSSFSRSCSPTSSSESSGWDSDEEFHPAAFGPRDLITPSILKKTRRSAGSVNFAGVTVFYFPRCQGFTSVPSRGGCTLGMVRRHHACCHFTLEEFAQEQSHSRKEKLRMRLREEKLEALKWKLKASGVQEPEEMHQLPVEEADVEVTDEELDSGAFLQPYSARQRRRLLRAVGVRRIDREEKQELQAIRLSREDCGCKCQDVCDPETCGCSVAGVKCQMDHTSFPCGCTKDGCGNPEGRVEFNQARVQTHSLHTLTRLELESRQESSQSEAELLQDSSAAAFACLEDEAGPLGPPPPTPTFPFPLGMEILGDSSCSSDTTDSSASSVPSEDPSEGRPYGGAIPSDKPPSDLDDDGLARILHFSDSNALEEDDEEEGARQGGVPPGIAHCQDDPGSFPSMDLFGTAAAGCPSHMASIVSDCLDENANQDALCYLDGLPTQPAAGAGSCCPLPPSTDLSLSSSDSLDLFQSFSDYSLGPFYPSPKDSESGDNLSVPQPAFSPTSDPTACFLESLIGLSESVPEMPAPFSDNQLLEDAIKSSLMEMVKV